MQWLAELCVKRPVFATVLILSLTVIGVFSFTRLGVDRFPKIDFPTITVTTVQPGAAPEQIETEITDKIEEAVNTISGIDDLRSVSSEGISQVIISFLLEKDTDVAAQEVRDKVNGVLPRLPKTIQQPRVDKMDPDAAPVLSLALSAKQPVRDITEYADKVLRRRVMHDVLARTIGVICRVRSLERQSLRSWTRPLRHHAAAEASVGGGASNPATRRANSSRVCRVAMQSNAASDIAARSCSPLYNWAMHSA